LKCRFGFIVCISGDAYPLMKTLSRRLIIDPENQWSMAKRIFNLIIMEALVL